MIHSLDDGLAIEALSPAGFFRQLHPNKSGKACWMRASFVVKPCPLLRLAPLAILVTAPMNVRAEAAKSLRIPAEMNTIISSIKTYRINCGELPPPELGLQALVTRPESRADKRWIKVADRIPTDPWNRPYRYVAGDGYPGGFGIYCCGKDGVSATRGNDPDDINSWGDPEFQPPDSPAVRRAKLGVAGVGLAVLSFCLGAKAAGVIGRRGEG